MTGGDLSTKPTHRGGMWARRLLWAPADRPAGARGIRGPIACVVILAAVVALGYLRGADDPGWSRVAYAGAAALLTSSAVILWISRNPVALALGTSAILLAGAVGAVAHDAEARAEHEATKWVGTTFHYDEKGRVLTREQAEAIPSGVTHTALRTRLGEPAGGGLERIHGERDMRCVAYRAKAPVRGPGTWLYAFCFRDGRYDVLREW